MRLEDVAGQDRAIAVLRRALTAGRLAHAYLFDGPEGVGKRSTAQALGLALLCPVAPGAGCGRCDTCARVLAANHPDVMLFDAALLPELAKASSEKSAVKYAARNVFPYALSAPHEAPARLLVIDAADELSPDVQNTMLKTLEEPRPGIHIVLCTAARDRLLPTILSRTQRIRFGALPLAALQTIGRAHGIAAGRATTAAALAGGSAARLLALASAEGDVGPFAEAAELRQAAKGRHVADLFDAAMRFGDKESKQQLPEILSLMAGLYRDALVSAAGAGELVQLGEHRAEIDAMAAASGAGAGDSALALGSLSRSLRAVLDAQEACLGNVNAVALLERLLFQLAHHLPANQSEGQAAHS
jgi:DNA polymerase-3 subunit delta'